MSKAILVIDMPSCCDECFALDYSGDYPVCLVTQEQRGYTFRTGEQRMNKCPLKKVPEKDTRDDLLDEYYDGFTDGWNACIDHILEEKN